MENETSIIHDSMFSTTINWPQVNLDELAKLAERMKKASEGIACEIRGNADSVGSLIQRLPERQPPERLKYETIFMGIPVYSDPTVPPGEVRVLNGKGEIIQRINIFS